MLKRGAGPCHLGENTQAPRQPANGGRVSPATIPKLSPWTCCRI